jgi:putative hemolysin
MPQRTPTSDVTGLANPASVHCIESGGTLEIVTGDDGGQFGMCVFPDGSQCEEWAFYRGDCAPASEEGGTAADGRGLYRNVAYGFSMEPAEGWSVEGQDNQVVFRKGDHFLFVGVKWVDEELPPFRTGMPAGDFVDGDTVTLLGQDLPTRQIVYEGKTKVVSYSPGVAAGDLLLFTWLDAEGDAIPYEDVDIPPEVVEQANQMVASFALDSGDAPELVFP